jgi:glycerol-3-phosphate acyltransferase PlsY
MPGDGMTAALLSIAGGYILGSISPSYILGRLVKRLDIRRTGTGNAGTVNVYKVLGLWPAVATAVFDLFKGILALRICLALGGTPLAAHLAGLAAIVGHVLPFYLRFRGGQGVATATGLLLYYLAGFYLSGWLPPSSLVLLALVSAAFGYIARIGEVVGAVVLPFLSLALVVLAPARAEVYFVLSVIAYIVLIEILNIRRQSLIDFNRLREKGVIGWRLYLRPAAFLFIVGDLMADKKLVLTILGAIVLIFLLLDLGRLFSRTVNLFFFQKVKKFYKDKEHKEFSSITLFLFALFLTILLFDRPVAVLAGAYLVFGDFFAKLFGMLFGRTRLFAKTLEGSLAHLSVCLFSGYILIRYVSMPVAAFVAGALAATAIEVLPTGIDDNFSVALISASVMYVFQLF